MVTFVIEDETDSIECLIFSSFYTEVKDLIREGAVVAAGGRLQITEREDKCIIEKVVKPEQYESIKSYGTYNRKTQNRQNNNLIWEIVTVSIEDKSIEGLDALKRCLLFNKGTVPVVLKSNNKVILLGNQYRIKKEERVIEALSQFGKVTIK